MEQAAAADALGIAQGTLRNIETTPGHFVSLRVIHRAARLYNCTATWLQGKDDDDAKPAEEPAAPARPPSGDPKGPAPRRNGKDNQRGPKRADLRAAS